MERFEVFKPIKYIPHNDKKKAFSLNKITRLNELVVPMEWNGIDIFYSKVDNLIAIREGSLIKSGKTRKDKPDYSGRNFTLGGFMKQFELTKSKWVFKCVHNGMDIYEQKEQQKEGV